jgi:hypothetical protein
MTTLHLSGNQGQVHFRPGPFDLYLCDETFRVETLKTESTTQSGRVFIAGAPDNARWVGGHIHGLMDLETEYSMYSKKGNGGSPFHIENCNGFIIDHLFVDGSCWDPIRIGTGARNPTILECLIRDARDECIEADHSGYDTVRVVRSFFENAHTYISTTPGAGAEATPFRWEFVDCLLELTNNQRDSRLKRKEAWNPTNYGSGQPWKANADGEHGTMLIRGCTLLWRRLPKQSIGNHALIPPRMALDPNSGLNIFVWLGPQTAAGNGGIPVVAVPKLGGGTMAVPESILGSGANRDRILSIYKFTDSEDFWLAERAAWFASVWNTSAPEPTPDPAPQPSPEPDMIPNGTVIPHDPAWQLAEGGIRVLYTTGPDTAANQGVVSKDASGNLPPGHLGLFVGAYGLADNHSTLRHQTATESLHLSWPVEPNTTYDMLLVFGEDGSAVYLNRDPVPVVSQPVPFSLAENTEPVLIGADAGTSDPGVTTPNRWPFQGTVHVFEIMTPAEVAAYLAGDPEPEEPEDPEEPGDCSAEVEAATAPLRAEIDRLNVVIEGLKSEIAALHDILDLEEARSAALRAAIDGARAVLDGAPE